VVQDDSLVLAGVGGGSRDVVVVAGDGEEEGVGLVARHAAAVEHAASPPESAVVRELRHRLRHAEPTIRGGDVPGAPPEPVDGSPLRPKLRRLPGEPGAGGVTGRLRDARHEAPLGAVERGQVAGGVHGVDEDERVPGVRQADEVGVVVAEEAVVVPDPRVRLAPARRRHLPRRRGEAARAVGRRDVAAALRQAPDGGAAGAGHRRRVVGRRGARD